MPAEATKNKPPIQALESPWAPRFHQAVLLLLGAALPFLALNFSITTYDQFELPKQVTLRVLTAFMLFFWALRLSITRRWEWKKTPLDWPVLAWSAWLVVKTFYSVSPSISWRGEYENFAGSLTQLNYSLIYFIATQHVRSFKQVERYFILFVASAGAAATYGILQALGLDFITWSASTVISDRYFASLGNPNFLGGLIIMAMPLSAVFLFSKRVLLNKAGLWALWASQVLALLFWLGMYLFFPPGHNLDLGRFFDQSHRWVFWVLLIYLACMLLFLFFLKSNLPRARSLLLGATLLIQFKALLDTGTRGAFLGLLAACLALAVLRLRETCGHTQAASASPRTWYKNPWVAALLILIGVSAASFLLGPALSQRMIQSLTHPLAAADQSRLQIWGPAIKIWKDFSLTGSGVDTFKTVFPHYSSSKFAEYDGANVSSRMAHCEPLQVLSTMGSIGLGLWLWLLAAWAHAWFKRRQATHDEENRLLLSGLFTFWLAYLVQNLVSFGVAAISAPFWIFMGFLWVQPEAKPSATAWPAPSGLRYLAGALGLVGIIPMLLLATSTYRADSLYNQGHIVTSQAQGLENADVDTLRSLVAYSLNELQNFKGNDTFVDQQAQAGLEKARQWDETFNQQGTNNPSFRQPYLRLTQRLLYLLAAAQQQQAVRLCPGEVKYHVYLGLAFEELFKLAENAQDAQTWFKLAEASYQQGVALNPRNAYYSGNLGRLYGLQVEMGQPSALDLAQKYYLNAIQLAPVTTLFYQNLMQLYIVAGQPEKALGLLNPLETKDAKLAGYLYYLDGSTMLQFSRNYEQQKNKPAALKLLTLSDVTLQKARSLRPDLADVLYMLALDHFFLGQKNEAQNYLAQCLQQDPNNKMALQFKQAQHW